MTLQSKLETGATSKNGSIAILVDCGIAQGHDPLVPFDRFPVPPAEIDFLFLTHAHIDHCRIRFS